MIGESLMEVLETGSEAERTKRYWNIFAAHQAVYEAIAGQNPQKAGQKCRNI